MRADDPAAKWRDLVGGFILAFGDIELTTFYLWREFVEGYSIPHNFKERTGRVLSALRRLDGYGAVVLALEQSLRLADKRNTIAHNPIQVQVYEHSKTGEVLFAHVIASQTAEDYIDDAELAELKAEAEDIATRLYLELGYIWERPKAD
jgi:hypothetical protein